jgi:hypothetical protein
VVGLKDNLIVTAGVISPGTDCGWCWRLTLIVENKKLAEESIFGNALAR